MIQGAGSQASSSSSSPDPKKAKSTAPRWLLGGSVPFPNAAWVLLVPSGPFTSHQHHDTWPRRGWDWDIRAATGMHGLRPGCSAGPVQPQDAESIIFLTRMARSGAECRGREKQAGSTHPGKRQEVSGTGSSPGCMSGCQHFCELFLVRKNIRMGRPALVASSSSHKCWGWQGLSSHHVTSSSAAGPGQHLQGKRLCKWPCR